MKIENIANPTANSTTQIGQQEKGQQSTRERAIAALMGSAKPQAQETAVADPSRVSPEEMTAIKAPSRLQESAQNHLDEDNSSSEPEAAPKAAEEPLSSQYAVLARKEKAIRQREQQLRARESAIKAQEDASRAPKAPTFDESKYVPKDRLSQDPFSVLTEMGLTYDQLTEMALNAPKPEQIAINNEIRALRDELKALRGENETTKKSFETQQTQAYDQAIAQIKSEARSLITHNPQFETIKETNSLSDVVDLIEETFKEDGILLTVEEAATQVEDYLVEEAMKIAKIKKIQQRLAPKPSAQAPKATDQSKQQQIKTLTNSVGTSRQLSARERALLAFEGKLSK